MIPVDVLTAILIIALVVVALAYVPRPERPDTCGDDGGHPTADQKIIAGLEDAVAHERGEPGRAKVTYPKESETGSGLP